MISPSLFRFQTRHPETGEWLEVEAEYFPARAGSRDRDGALLEPGDPEEMLIRRVWNGAGEPVPFGEFEPELLRRAAVFTPAIKALAR